MTVDTEVLAQAKSLTARIYGIDISSQAGIFGIDGADTALLKLRKTSAELVQVIQQDKPVATQTKVIQVLEAELRSAQLLGLMSETQLQLCMTTIDKLYELTEKES